MSGKPLDLGHPSKHGSRPVRDPALAEDRRAVLIPVRATGRNRAALLDHLGRFQADCGDLLWDKEMREQSGLVFTTFTVWLVLDLTPAGVARIRQAGSRLYQFMIDHACCRLEAIFYRWRRDTLLEVLARLEQPAEPSSAAGLGQQPSVG